MGVFPFLLLVAAAAMAVWCKKANTQERSVERRVAFVLTIALLAGAVGAILSAPEEHKKVPASPAPSQLQRQQREAQDVLERVRAAKSLVVTLEYQTHLRVAPLADPYSGVQFTRGTLKQGAVKVLFVGYEGTPAELSFWQDGSGAWRIGCVYGGVRHDLQSPGEARLRELAEVRGRCPSLYPNPKDDRAAG